jgi:hypothetical protein
MQPMSTLLIYLILNGLGRWEFLTIERVSAQGYCEALQRDVARVYEARPGNVRIICAEGKPAQI